MTQVEEDWLRDEPDHLDSDADTEIMTTPEFYGSLTGGNVAYPGKHEAAIDSSSLHVSNRSIDSEDPKGLQSVEQLQSGHQTLKVTQNLCDDPLGAAGSEGFAIKASDYEERQEFFESVVLNFHSDTVDPKVFLTCSALSSAEHSPHSPARSNSERAPSVTSETITLEVTEKAGFSEEKLPLISSAGFLKRKLLYDDQTEPRRSARLAQKDKIQQ
ncbi:hypothetical protein PENSUB_4446 [Penicillium subrubescens]|uniref:Uncharacterized protein n=1 Tax=Penicillium subrubescens TaxID=1316194 RepID=A0A1Q5UCF6_9EURO|nr:hypothetical protein PENSUB_4446 [Penicillium subrubescens]